MAVKVKKFVPRAIKQPVKKMLLRRQLRAAIKAIANLGDGQIPRRELLSELMAGWSNEGYAANLEYLEAVAGASLKTAGPVLECGSGATTILLAILCGKRNVQVWSLEHFPEWRAHVSETLNENGLSSGAHVCSSPLKDYGDFAWYDPPLAEMPTEFSLVICDGPPGSTKGGRYGLLPVMGKHLPPGATILLDDAGRPGELELIRKWEVEAGFKTELIKTEASKYAVMRRSS